MLHAKPGGFYERVRGTGEGDPDPIQRVQRAIYNVGHARQIELTTI